MINANFHLFLVKRQQVPAIVICIPTQIHILNLWQCIDMDVFSYCVDLLLLIIDIMGYYWLIVSACFDYHWYCCADLFFFWFYWYSIDYLPNYQVSVCWCTINIKYSFFYFFRRLKWVWSNVERVRKTHQFFYVSGIT